MINSKIVYEQYKSSIEIITIKEQNSGGVFFFLSNFLLWLWACGTFGIEFFDNLMCFLSSENHGFSPDIGSLDLDGASVFIKD